MEYGNANEMNSAATFYRHAKSILTKLRLSGISNFRAYKAGLYTLPEPDSMLKATPDFILKYTNEQGEDVTESIECKNPFY